ALGLAAATLALERAEARLAKAVSDDGNEAISVHAEALDAWLTAGGATVDGDLEAAAARLGLAASLLDRPVSTLSSGQGVRAALLPLAARRHDAVLLDEPTNHLDTDGRALLESLLDAHGGAVVVASHDRAFLARYANRILALDARGGEATPYAGGWDAYEREADLARRGAEEAYTAATAERDALREAEREIRRRAVSTQNRIGKTARDGDKHVKEWFRMRADGVEARGRVVGRRADRVEIPDKPWVERPLALQLTPALTRAPHVVALEDAVVRRGAWTSPVFDLAVALGDRILLRGPNGSGKSTLLEALAGTAPLLRGRRSAGTEGVVSVLGAVESALRADEALTSVVRRLAGLDPAEARGRLAHAGLTAEVAGRPASTLSPGERTRAELAVLGAQRTTCLLLDEPSNHLDLRSLEALEVALDGWPGALVVATHDERLAERLRPTREVVL
ncbi:MAG: ATP-binding cassette domain-containing protein, partial [Solirubrobacteraceae bacterium]|nr:ATP-binding cassette domain-containing protein [Solirubrobacteraceae bacterium]